MNFGHLFLNKDIETIKANSSDNSIIAKNNNKWSYYLENNSLNCSPNKKLKIPFIFFELREIYNRNLSIYDNGKKILTLDFSEGKFAVPSTVIEMFLESEEQTLTDETFESFKLKAIERISNSQRVKNAKRELFSFDFNKLKVFDINDAEIMELQQLLSFYNFINLYTDAESKLNLFDEFLKLMQIKMFDVSSYKKALGVKQNFVVL